MTHALRPEELLDPPTYERERLRWAKRVGALKRARRVELGPTLSICFEDRETVLRHVQEVLHVEGVRCPDRVLAELSEYTVLVPTTEWLTATLMITGGSVDGLGRALCRGNARVELVINDVILVADLTDAPIGDCPVRYLRFDISDLDLGARSVRMALRLGVTSPRGFRVVEAIQLSPFTVRALCQIARASAQTSDLSVEQRASG